MGLRVTAVVEHPLAPLSAEEIDAAAAILRAEERLRPGVRVHSMTLKEPAKDEVLGYEAGRSIDREVLVVLRERARRTTLEAVVSLTAGELRSWRERTDVQPPITIEELMACEREVKANPDWQRAMRERGVTDFELAMVDPWPTGYNGPDDDPARAGRSGP